MGYGAAVGRTSGAMYWACHLALYLLWHATISLSVAFGSDTGWHWRGVEIKPNDRI